MAKGRVPDEKRGKLCPTNGKIARSTTENPLSLTQNNRARRYLREKMGLLDVPIAVIITLPSRLEHFLGVFA